MKIGFCFFGIIYGPGGRTGSARDFRHCWPNLKSMLIEPFVAQGHEAKIYFSGYPFTDREIENQFHEIVKPDGIVYSNFDGSDPFTTKGKAFDAFEHEDLDLIVFTRSDIHFSKIIANENIDYDKFNFLFRELDWWETNEFTCDNLYIYPHKWTSIVKKAIFDTYGFPRGKPLVDTHALFVKLKEYLPVDKMHTISDTHELSDVNSYYTCCRSGLPTSGRGENIHPEVRERFHE
jgi:hypothetical protein